jgi:DNA-binding response OmpR family regulator
MMSSPPPDGIGDEPGREGSPINLGSVTFLPEDFTISGRSQVEDLSRLECRMLLMLARLRGEWMDRPRLADRVWHVGTLDMGAIDQAVVRLRKKLRAVGFTGTLETSKKRGCRLLLP